MAYPTVEKRWVITGGNLAGDKTWIPSRLVHLQSGGMAPFIALQTKDLKLTSFCGLMKPKDLKLTSYQKPTSFWSECSLVDMLKSKRNKCVDELFLAHVRANDAYGNYARLPARYSRSKSTATLPECIDVDLPRVEFVGKVAEALSMRVLEERNVQAFVTIEMTAANLHYLNVAAQSLNGQKTEDALEEERVDRKRGRARDESVAEHIVSKRIKPDYRRKALVLRWRNADGVLPEKESEVHPLGLAWHRGDGEDADAVGKGSSSCCTWWRRGLPG